MIENDINPTYEVSEYDKQQDPPKGGKQQKKTKNAGEQTANNSPEEGNTTIPDMTGEDIIDEDAKDPTGKSRQKISKQNKKKMGNTGEQGEQPHIEDAYANIQLKIQESIGTWKKMGFFI